MEGVPERKEISLDLAAPFFVAVKITIPPHPKKKEKKKREETRNKVLISSKFEEINHNLQPIQKVLPPQWTIWHIVNNLNLSGLFGESPMCEIIFHPIFWHN